MPAGQRSPENPPRKKNRGETTRGHAALAECGAKGHNTTRGDGVAGFSDNTGGIQAIVLL